jgi:hypothetical protein
MACLSGAREAAEAAVAVGDGLAPRTRPGGVGPLDGTRRRERPRGYRDRHTPRADVSGTPTHGARRVAGRHASSCGSRKPIATVIRKMGVHVITPPVVHHDAATHPRLGLPGSSPPLTAGPAVAPDNPWSDPGACASNGSTESTRSGVA